VWAPCDRPQSKRMVGMSTRICLDWLEVGVLYSHTSHRHCEASPNTPYYIHTMSTTFIEIYNDLITRRQTIPLTPLRWFSDVISANINDLYLNGENEKKVSVEMIILLYILNDDLAAARDLVIAHLLADNDEARERRKTSTAWYLHYVLQRRL
jgi:hypothetical protein